MAILRRSVRSTDFVGLPRTSLVSTPRRRKRNGAWMRSASSRMRSGPIERQAANALRSSRMDTEPGLISTRRMRRSRGAAEALSLLLPEHSPSKKRRTEASSCIVGVWIQRGREVVASTCCRMRCTTVCSSIGAGSRQPGEVLLATVLDEAPGDLVAEPLPVFLFGVARRQPVPGLVEELACQWGGGCTALRRASPWFGSPCLQLRLDRVQSSGAMIDGCWPS